MRHLLVSFTTTLLALGLFSQPAAAQPTFSVDFQGPTAGTPLLDGFFTVPISEGAILTTSVPGPPGPNPALPGPLPPPGVEVGAALGAVGVVPGGLGVIPGLSGCVEVDALSYGFDVGNALYFSVDEYAAGVPGPLPPDTATEGSAGATEASADVFRYLGPAIPTPPGLGPGNTAHIDGDGVAPSGLPGLGLIEPNPPSAGILPDPGDNLDALDVDTALPHLGGLIFFSLDSGFPDPLEPFPPTNCGTAIGNAVSGADVLVSFAGGFPFGAIPAAALGLDLTGFDTDDIDALAFFDADGSASLTAVDTILFSVRRGSAVIGALDSAFGLPIEPGDILTVPTAAGLPPAIFISADNLNLGTVRSATAGPFGADELDALDLAPGPPSLPPSVPAMGPWGIVVLIVAMAAGPVWVLRSRGRRS